MRTTRRSPERSSRVVRHGTRAVRVTVMRSVYRPIVIAPLAGVALPSAQAVRHALDDLVAAYLGASVFVVTPALDRREREPFLQAGGEVIDDLHLLSRSLELPVPPPARPQRTRRTRRRDWSAVEQLDDRAFEPFWHFGADELLDALEATPSARFRIVGDDHPAGYAVCGRAGRTGYVQRLAVDPDDQGTGVGSALLVDGLQWMRRHGARRALVNTQHRNQRALDLYLRHGFVVEPSGLAVVGFQLGAP